MLEMAINSQDFENMSAKENFWFVLGRRLFHDPSPSKLSVRIPYTINGLREKSPFETWSGKPILSGMMILGYKTISVFEWSCRDG